MADSQIRTFMKTWQVAWHDLFDADATLRQAGEFQRPNPIPPTVDDDYRLCFDLTRTEPATRAACFGCLPMGQEMHRRFETYLTGAYDPMEEAQARAVFAELAEAVEACGPTEKVD